MPFTINSTHIENDEVSLTENSNGNLVLEHKPTGQTMTLDGTAVDVGGDDLTTTGAVNAASASVTNGFTAGSVDTDALNDDYRPSPGEVQTAIDNAATDGGGAVYLRPGMTYDPGATWVVKDGVSLHCNDAVISLSSDINLFEVRPNARVFDPIVVLPSGYTSVVFLFDGSSGAYRAQHDTRVEGGVTDGTAGEGTLVRFHDNGNHIQNTVFNHDCDGIDTAVDIFSETDYINDIRVGGFLKSFIIGINQRGTGIIDTNEYRVSLLPDTNGPASEGWRIDLGRDNYLRGAMWDNHVYSNAAWRLTSNAGTDNRVCVPNAGFGRSHVSNSSGNEAHILDLSDLGQMSKNVIMDSDDEFKMKTALNLRQNNLKGIRQGSNLGSSNMFNGEIAFDDNQGGTGAFALVVRDQNGNFRYFTPDG